MSSANYLRWGAPVQFEAIGASFFTISTLSMPNQNDGIGMVWKAPAADTITDIGFRVGVTTGITPVLGHSIGAWGLTTSGLPDSTNKLTTDTAFTSGADSTWQWVALGGNAFAVTMGQTYSTIMIRNAANDAGNKITAARSVDTVTLSSRPAYPIPCTAAAGTWAKFSSATPLMAVRSASTVYGYPAQGSATNTFGNTTEVGMLFTAPANFGASFQIAGIRFSGTTASAAKTWVASLYTLNGSRVPQATIPTQATTSTDSDSFGSNSSANRSIECYFTTLVTLTPGTLYAIGLATTTAGDMTLNSMTVSAAGDWDAYPGQQQISYSSRVVAAYPPAADATAFAAGTTTQRPLIELILADMTAATASGASMARVFTGM